MVPKSAAICGSSEFGHPHHGLARKAGAREQDDGARRDFPGFRRWDHARLDFVGKSTPYRLAAVDRAERGGLFTANSPERNSNDRQDIPALRGRGAHLRQRGKRRARSAAAGRSAATPSRFASSFRRPTSPARCIWAMRSTTRSRTCSCASSACAAATCSGSPAPTTPASPPRWWSSASSWNARSLAGARSAARNSSKRCGRGRRNRAAPSPPSSSASAPPATGRASASPWTRGSRAPCSRCSWSSIARA